MGAVGVGGAQVRNLFRGILVVLAAGLMILPAFINYELWHRGYLSPVASMAVSLQFFAIGVIVFILAVGKERFEGKT